MARAILVEDQGLSRSDGLGETSSAVSPCAPGNCGLSARLAKASEPAAQPAEARANVAEIASVLRKDADGKHYLVTPAEKVDVDVADAPFLAVEMQVEGSGRGQSLVFRTNVDDIVTAGREHPLRFAIEPSSQGLKPYLHVRGRLEALVTRALYYDLVEMAVTEERDGRQRLGLWSGGVFFPMPAV